jgi:acyl carrier protein
MADISEKLKKMVADQLGVDEELILPSASFDDDLNIDYSDMAELITE